MSLLSKNIRIRFRFSHVDTTQTLKNESLKQKKAICRAHLVDLCTLSTVRSVASRYLQKALSEPSSQHFEIISVTTGDGYDMPLYESAHIFRDDDVIEVLYSVKNNILAKAGDIHNCTEITGDDDNCSSKNDRKTKRRSRNRRHVRRRNGSFHDQSNTIVMNTVNITSPEKTDVSSVWQYLQHQQLKTQNSQKKKSTVVQSHMNDELQTCMVVNSAQEIANGYWYPIDLAETSFCRIQSFLQKGSLVYYSLQATNESNYGTVDTIKEEEDGQWMLYLWNTASISGEVNIQETMHCLSLRDFSSLHLYHHNHAEVMNQPHSENIHKFPVIEKESYEVVAEGNAIDKDLEHDEGSSMATNSMDVMYLLLAKKAQFELSPI